MGLQIKLSTGTKGCMLVLERGMKLTALLFFLVCFIACSMCSAGTTYYINGATGNDAWDGLAPAWDGTHGPKKTIQAGINASAAADTVSVADGTYTGTGNKNLDYAGKEITVSSQNGAENCIIDCQNSGRGFYFHTNETNASVVEGFTIKNGNVTGTNPSDNGGAICCVNSSPSILSCIIKENTASNFAGGIFGAVSNIRIIDSTVIGNKAAKGAGITIYSSLTPRVENCNITYNSAQNGGGMYIGGAGTFINNVIEHNHAGGSGGGIYVYSTGIPFFIGSSILENTAEVGGGFFCTVHTQPAITNCIISRNVAKDDGGAFYCADDAKPVISSCEISRNFAHEGGSVLYCITGASPELANSVVERNVADTEFTSAFYFRETSLPKITNCVIICNTGEDGADFLGSDYNSIVYVRNCIIRGNNQNTVRITQGGIADISYSNIEGGYPGDGNIDADPHFINPAESDYHLAFNSPCIDSGTSDGAPATDKNGGTRWDHPLVPNTGGGAIRYYDMGIFEFKDSDLDSLPDYWENLNALNPNDNGSINPDNGSSGDPDGDGLNNLAEHLNSSGARYRDTDLDGHNDLSEVSSGTNPAHRDNVEKTYYVNYEIGDDGYDGLSAALGDIHGPKKTIQAGIAAAIDGWGYMVEVAEGTYPVGGTETLDFEGKAIVLKSKNGAENTIIDCEMNGRAFKFHSREGSNSIIDGFKIINGLRESDIYEQYSSGGAIHIIGSSPTILNCSFLDCTSVFGGAICTYYAKPIVEKCTFERNRAYFGGAIHLRHSFGLVKECVIQNNQTTAANGGGIEIDVAYSNDRRYPTINGCIIKFNGAVLDGGGISCQDYGTIINCVISGNSANRGGGIYGRAMIVERCEISGNSANTIGGGVYGYLLTDNMPAISDCIIANNIAGQDGGGIYSDEFNIENTIFRNNVAANRGGGIFTLDGILFNCLVTGNHANNGGGAFIQSDLTMTNCTFVENTSSINGGGLETASSGDVEGYNCIFWNNLPNEIYRAPSSTMVLFYSDIKGGWAGLGNINQDPLFVRGHLHNYYLSHSATGQVSNSPCIDEGRDPSAELGLDVYTTRTDFGSDVGMVDMGYHSPYALYAFSIIQIGSDIRIRWSANPGVSYVVEWSEDMASWTKVPVGQVSEWTDANAGGCEKRFYRVLEDEVPM